MAGIETENLTKYYRSCRGIEDLSLRVEEGEIFGFLPSVLINGQRAALSVGIGFIVFGFVFYKVLVAFGEAAWFTRRTPFYYADPTKILATGGVDWRDNVVFVPITAALLAATLALFRRKNIAV